MILEVLLTPQSQRDFLYQECVGLDSNQRGFTFHECMTLNEAILYWKCFFHFQNRLVGNPLLQLSYIIFFLLILSIGHFPQAYLFHRVTEWKGPQNIIQFQPCSCGHGGFALASDYSKPCPALIFSLSEMPL